MEGFNSQQGASNRDVEVDKVEVVAADAATVEDVVDAYRLHMHQEVYPSTSPRWKDPNKVIYQALTAVELPLGLRVDRPPAEPDAKTQGTQTATKYSTTGMCVIHIGLTLRTATIQLRVGRGRWTTRKASHGTMHRHTLTQDMRQSQRECIRTFYQQTFDGGGQR